MRVSSSRVKVGETNTNSRLIFIFLLQIWVFELKIKLPRLRTDEIKTFLELKKLQNSYTPEKLNIEFTYFFSLFVYTSYNFIPHTTSMRNKHFQWQSGELWFSCIWRFEGSTSVYAFQMKNYTVTKYNCINFRIANRTFTLSKLPIDKLVQTQRLNCNEIVKLTER